MNYQYPTIPDIRTYAFVRVKILCFLILYFLVGLLILSFFIEKLASYIALLDLPKWRSYFGMYLIITGISTAAISTWKGKTQTIQMINSGACPLEQRNLYDRAWKIANLIAGFVFIIGGILFGISSFGEINGWWPSRVIYGSTSGRMCILFFLFLPMMCGSFVANTIIGIQNTKDNN